ncbi:MAG: murein transglycosylase [Magnetovibrio sp.]|nr:murein transglycosylase [Magnetovibrio sp.]|tara:strand:- start:1083 stop:2300 length:1218 start_codon:yes stop_codon:yes gene_type:complete
MRSVILLLLPLITACAQLTPQKILLKKPQKNQTISVTEVRSNLVLTKTSFKNIVGWNGDRHDQALAAFLRSCVKIRKNPSRSVFGSISEISGDWLKTCNTASSLPLDRPDLARHFFETRFQPFLATASGQPEGLFTGYFEMELRGSWLRKKSYTTPIYGRPPELVEADLGAFRDDYKGKRLLGKIIAGKFVPFADRAEIEAGALSGRGLELIWVDSLIDAFFLHIQGSGRVLMDDGTIIRIGYASGNGHVYNSIGKELIKIGELRPERVSMQAIRTWLENHTEQASKIMQKNRSFIFFRIISDATKSLDESQGPIGAQGVLLTPGRSLAVDRNFIPLGIPIWLDTTDPINLGEPLRRLVIAQDTGSAIKGPVRGDLFWGFGSLAAAKAGLMKQKGRYFLLLPKKD